MRTTPWAGDFRLSEMEVAVLLRGQFPGLHAQQVRFFAQGFDCVAFEVDDGLLFKFPKRMASDGIIRSEVALLTQLAGKLAIPVPKPLFLGHPGELFEGSFYGYMKLPGMFLTDIEPERMDLARLAAQAGQFLTKLHHAEIDAPPLHVPAAWPHEIGRFQEAFDEVAPLLENGLAAKLAKEIRDFSLVPEPDLPNVLTHADLSPMHLLVNPGESAFTGVLGWHDAAWSNPVVDFTAFYEWGGPLFVAQVLKYYEGPLDERALPWLRQNCWVAGLFEAFNSLKSGNLKDRSGGLRAIKTALEGQPA
jgi:aminoglycoside phosphotransferase (APT) family kinase protein